MHPFDLRRDLFHTFHNFFLTLRDRDIPGRHFRRARKISCSVLVPSHYHAALASITLTGAHPYACHAISRARRGF
jgi:hypothetical protein